ncbi:DUF2141 domain-containing protein [Pararhodospirillum oryzae]|uniref:DUF2141 domain-containing protein n=1 Tax=Pararhodospirillum oryzae TaxID=478448 RepID=A0A512H5X3_9PROT|nr:DUF2141 domain-containing protein [Pararhodospirillum oryzae]GEO80780.1 hypothetical protein ROR02_09110 [Pararhodospirillum oryzae]
MAGSARRRRVGRTVAHALALALGICLGTGLGLARAAQGADLTVILTGVQPGPGPLRIAVYTGPKGFATPEGVTVGKAVPADAPTVRVVFHDLPVGPVAVLAHHDQNNNGRMDRLLGLLPTEGYGIGQETGLPAPPTWEKSQFPLPAKGAQLTIIMRYPVADSKDTALAP